jgi:hypothetical protein
MRKLVGALVLAGVVASAAAGGEALGAASQHVILCHFTGDTKTPYHLIDTSPSGAYHAHYQHHDDIIPPFQFKGVTYSRNWDAKGRAIWNNGCVPPAPSGGGGGGSGGGQPPQVSPSPVPGSPSFTG